MRRSTNPTRKISITIPSRIFDKLESHLSYDQSRSRFISSAIEDKLGGVSAPGITELTTRQLMAALVNRNDVEKGLEVQLLHLLS